MLQILGILPKVILKIRNYKLIDKKKIIVKSLIQRNRKKIFNIKWSIIKLFHSRYKLKYIGNNTKYKNKYSSKRLKLSDWLKDQSPCICCTPDTWKLKMKGWKKLHCANSNQNKTGADMLILDMVDFTVKSITPYEQRQYLIQFSIDTSQFLICRHMKKHFQIIFDWQS